MTEFTGERVIPGQADADLWNEHLARYAFAARLTAGRRVLDAGCGAGYGSAALARTARSVVGVDVAAEAVAHAHEHYAAANLHYLAASCAALPIADASADVVVAFEVIEHVAEWEKFLAEVRRVLAPRGVFIVSTPNKDYYAESRRLTGPNPFHVHEFDAEEFSAELRKRFPHVALYLENHIEGIGFQLAGGPGTQFETCVVPSEADPAAAHFFLAVCSSDPLTVAPYLYVPGTGNILRERELHIARLESELATKDRWLEELRKEKQNLVDMFRQQSAELDRSNQWAQDLDEKLRAAGERIVSLQEELAQTIAGYQASIAAYETQAAETAADLRTKIEWATGLNTQLEEKGKELLHTIELLDTAENTVIERTAWATRVDAELRELEALMMMVRSSRWLKLGRVVGLGPVLPGS